MNEKLLIVGDNHLSSNNRSNHTDYAQESLKCLEYINQMTKDLGVDYYIDLGDISYGKFELSYRAKVESIYEDRFKHLNGRCLSVRGNHDISNKTISEWEYYTQYRKLLNNCEGLVADSEGYRYIDIGKSRLHFVDYGHESVELKLRGDGYNFVCAHNFFKFRGTQTANFGNAIELDYHEQWFGIDGVFCGHIHNKNLYSGSMLKDGKSKEVFIYYPGSIVRTDFTKNLPTEGEMLLVTLSDEIQLSRVKIPWIPEEEAFQIGDIIKEKKKVDISDIVKELNDREQNIGDPEIVIKNMTGFEERYKEKAIQLLKDV